MLLQKDLGSVCFSSTSQFSVNKCKKSAVSKKIVSVMAPHQSERRPATTGSVKFPSFDLNLIILIDLLHNSDHFDYYVVSRSWLDVFAFFVGIFR